MGFGFIWKKNLRNKIKKLEKENIDWVLEGINLFKIKDTENLKYVNGIGDGYRAACQDILKWIEKKER